MEQNSTNINRIESKETQIKKEDFLAFLNYISEYNIQHYPYIHFMGNEGERIQLSDINSKFGKKMELLGLSIEEDQEYSNSPNNEIIDFKIKDDDKTETSHSNKIIRNPNGLWIVINNSKKFNSIFKQLTKDDIIKKHKGDESLSGFYNIRDMIENIISKTNFEIKKQEPNYDSILEIYSDLENILKHYKEITESVKLATFSEKLESYLLAFKKGYLYEKVIASENDLFTIEPYSKDPDPEDEDSYTGYNEKLAQDFYEEFESNQDIIDMWDYKIKALDNIYKNSKNNSNPAALEYYHSLKNSILYCFDRAKKIILAGEKKDFYYLEKEKMEKIDQRIRQVIIKINKIENL